MGELGISSPYKVESFGIFCKTIRDNLLTPQIEDSYGRKG